MKGRGLQGHQLLIWEEPSRTSTFFSGLTFLLVPQCGDVFKSGFLIKKICDRFFLLFNQVRWLCNNPGQYICLSLSKYPDLLSLPNRQRSQYDRLVCDHERDLEKRYFSFIWQIMGINSCLFIFTQRQTRRPSMKSEDRFSGGFKVRFKHEKMVW